MTDFRVIVQPCVNVKDGACVQVCPVDCIHPRKDEEDFERVPHLYIDPDTCIGCGLCDDECPVKAIFPVDDVPDDQKDFVEANAAYYKR